MSRLRLVYFDFAGSRGEECRIALHLAGIDFEDVRVKSDEWPAMKINTPFGAMPVLEIPGKAPLAHSNAILVFIGRQHRLHPADAFEAFFSNPKTKNHRLTLFVASRVRALALLPRPGMATRFLKTPPPTSASMSPLDISVIAKQSADSVSSVLRIHREN